MYCNQQPYKLSEKYESPKHELSKHLVWLSNKHYTEEHNNYADVLGYGLKMNQFGDLVRLEDLYTAACRKKKP